MRCTSRSAESVDVSLARQLVHDQFLQQMRRRLLLWVWQAPRPRPRESAREAKTSRVGRRGAARALSFFFSGGRGVL